MKAYYEDYKNRIRTEEHWYGNKYKTEFVLVKILGKTFSSGLVWYLIKLPNGEIRETTQSYLYFSLNSREVKKNENNNNKDRTN